MTNSSKFNISDNRFGKALIANTSISAGEQILKISGRILRKPQDISSAPLSSHLIQIGTSLYYDPEPPGRFINHSCSPNSILSGSVLIAITSISTGQEITFDYSTTMLEDNYTLDCLCGSPECRGVIKDFTELPKPLQRKYIDLGGVQHFILIQCCSAI